MSEFSESLHFHRASTLPEDALHAALRASTLTGALLPLSASWHAFVPFETYAPDNNPDGDIGARLSLMVGAPVLEYHFAEDVYWAVLIWNEGELVSVYTCRFLSHSLRIDDSEHDPHWLEALLPEGTSADVLAPVLYPAKRKGDAGRAAGKRFAEVMQLGNVEWLGPTTIADRLEDMADSAGVLVLGSPPPAEPVVRMPKPVKSFAPVELPGSALTARDAVAVLEPFVREWAPDATLLILTGSVLDFALDERPTQGPWIGEDGRTTSTGGWWLLFRSASREQRLDISLHVESAKMVRVDDAYNSPSAVDAITEHWMDSDAVARITEPIYVAWRTTDTPPLRDFVMKLTQREQAPLWRVNYLCVQSGMMRRELQLTLHATTGEVIGVVSSD
ncbi:hypothetical protein [Gemmatimonas sp.]|uniref:hypothetical protein n=1 Tax=Gemmatimonas sp. TaxID=1962908 RepID=UPI0025C18818|nr:hypothetical protein [Gemmatimonas sp.]MCA2992968.1 hypothetical protein [Gemmatimonas sp.]